MNRIYNGTLNAEAFDSYIEYRKEMKFKTLKPASVSRLQKWLVKQGDAEIQEEIIDRTIRNGWIGLFELDGKEKEVRSSKQRLMDELEPWFNEKTGVVVEGEFRRR